MAELTNIEKDTIAEVGNISLGSAATALSNLLGKPVRITTPQVSVVTISEVKENYPVPSLLLQIQYLTGLEGENVLIIKEKDAKIIAALMMGMDPLTQELPEELGEVEESAVGEAMNQMMGYAATSMSELFNRTIDITPPTIEKKDLQSEQNGLTALEEDEEVAQAAFRIEVDGLIDSTLIQVIPIAFAKNMTSYLLYGEEAVTESEAEAAATSDTSETTAAEKAEVREELQRPEGEEKEEDDDDEALGQDAINELINKTDQVLSDSSPKSEKIYWSQEAEEPPPVSPDASLEERLQQLDMVKDVPVKVTVILGRNQLPLGKLLNLGKEGILELDRYNHEPVEIYVNEMQVGRGEVVVVNGQLGVRITSMDININRKSVG